VKLLLDTHIWIWSFLEPKKIAPRVAKLLENPAIEKWLSPISLWEFIVLVEKGRIELDIEVRTWIARALTEFSPREAHLTTDIVLAIPGIGLKHRDPADAFLLATAKVLDLTLVTADSRLLSAKGVSTLPNR
jgi:PIN domain nuclease of toxin-antitoxin system